MTGMGRLVVIAAISSVLFGCSQSHRQLPGGYYLERFTEGGPSLYYVGAPGQVVDGGGVFDGTVQELGWSNDWILARVKRLYHGDINGWYAVNVRTGKIVGPLQASELKTNPAFSNIATVPAAVAFSRGE